MITDHDKWVKTCVNKEDSTYDYNVINNEEFFSVQSSKKSTATCCIMHLTCYKKSDYKKLDKRSKKLTNFVCLGFAI